MTQTVQAFEKKLYLASPTMHGEELRYMQEAYETNWMSTLGANIDSIETQISELIGCEHAVALSSGTAALHLAVRLAGERLYGKPDPIRGSLAGHQVFCTDMTFDATVNPVAYEGGEAIFIDSERETWNMDPEALKEAFARYPDVRLVVYVHLYGTPGRIDEIRAICDGHDALLVEDAAESLGATFCGRQTGCFGDYNVISFNGNKIITGSSGGMLLTHDKAAADKARKWSTQARDAAPWYQHTELGYNYRMSNVIAGVVRGQLPYLDEHIAQKKKIYERYRKGFVDLPVSMNPYHADETEPNFWLSCILIDRDAMCEQKRTDMEASYKTAPGKSCPTEILEAIASINAEGRPIWKPMHMQPIYKKHSFVSLRGNLASGESKDLDESVAADIFERGLCLPSDNKMTKEQQEIIIDVIHRCFA